MKRLLFLSLAIFSFCCAFAQPQKVVADKIVAIVGDRIILQSDVVNALADARRQGQELPADAECKVLEQALVSKVLMLQAEKDSLPVTEEEIEAELDQRLARLRARLLQDSALQSPARDWQETPAEQQPVCPECGQVLEAKGSQRRELQTHGQQAVVLERQYGVCPKCGLGFFPPG